MPSVDHDPVPPLLRAERYSLRDASKLAQVHVGTIWRWVLHGVRGRKLHTIMIGGRRFILGRDLYAFLAPSDEGDVLSTPMSDDVRRRAEETGAELERFGL